MNYSVTAVDPLKPKRDRTINFSYLDIQLLVNLVYKYSNIIEDKTTNAIMWRKKEDTWKKVTAEFNAENPIKRTVKMLRMKYDSLKRILKKKTASNRFESFRVGGNNSSITPYTDYEEKLLAILAMGIQGNLPRETMIGKVKHVGAQMQTNKTRNQIYMKESMSQHETSDEDNFNGNLSVTDAKNELTNLQLNLIKQEPNEDHLFIEEHDVSVEHDIPDQDHEPFDEENEFSNAEQDTLVEEQDLSIKDEDSQAKIHNLCRREDNNLNKDQTQCNPIDQNLHIGSHLKDAHISVRDQAHLFGGHNIDEEDLPVPVREHTHAMKELELSVQQEKEQTWREKAHKLSILYKQKKLQQTVLKSERKEEEHDLKMLMKEKKLEFYILENERKKKEHEIKKQILEHQLKCIKHNM